MVVQELTIPPHNTDWSFDDSQPTPSSPAGQFPLPTDLTLINDLTTHIKGMYRLLHLYKEQGSRGVVDKILITQEPLAELMNKLAPGSHLSISEINFALLDQFSIRPLGVYGDKAAIVKFLRRVTYIDDRTATHLLSSTSTTTSHYTSPTLPSGLYLFLPDSELVAINKVLDTCAFVIYWPEDTTWNDNAVAAVRRNRTSFMRYLTKLTPQIRCLISEDLANTIVWKGTEKKQDTTPDDSDSASYDDEIDHDRCFDFEVEQATEKEDGARIYPGFKFTHPSINATTFPQNVDRPEHSSSSSTGTRLIFGECKQGFLASRSIPYHKKSESIDNEFTVPGLKSMLDKHPNISFDKKLSEEGLWILLDVGDLQRRAPSLVTGYRQRVEAPQATRDKEYTEALVETQAKFQQNWGKLAEQVKLKLAETVVNIYPDLKVDRILDPSSSGEGEPYKNLDYLKELYERYPSIITAEKQFIAEAKLHVINNKSYQGVKKRLLKNYDKLMKHTELSPEALKILFDSILSTAYNEEPSVSKETERSPSIPLGGESDTNDRSRTFGKDVSQLFNAITNQRPHLQLLKSKKLERVPGFRPGSGGESETIDQTGSLDQEFIQRLCNMSKERPNLQPYIDNVLGIVYRWASEYLNNLTPRLVTKFARSQEESLKKARNPVDSKLRQQEYNHFKAELQDVLCPSPDAQHLVVKEVRYINQRKAHTAIYLKAESKSYSNPRMAHTIFSVGLTEGDMASVIHDPEFIPYPTAFETGTFHLSLNDSIRHIQAIENKFLLIVDRPSSIAIWLNDCYLIGRVPPLKLLPTSDRKYHFAVHEQQRLLAIVYIETKSEDQIFLQLQSMDEAFSTLDHLDTPRNVTNWYPDEPLDIKHICFAGGVKELCIIEGSGRVRIYSFLSHGFRASAVQLPPGISDYSAYSAPDDSALIIVERTTPQAPGHRLRLYHWDPESFKQDCDGVVLDLPGETSSEMSFCVSSLGQRSGVVVIALSAVLNAMQYFNLRIRTKGVAYSFIPKAADLNIQKTVEATYHNSFIDCHADVWTTYPVVSIFRRETIMPSGKSSPCLTFVCGLNSDLFSAYFKRLIKDFENLTKKPTGRMLANIEVHAKKIEDLNWKRFEARSFKAGEWFMELLCLIPIQIAVARHKGFVPLKDGVLDSHQEQRLLGATVDQITDSITLGWYESILNSYMAVRPVKVISSMGEQSVGKSYMLNHIVDSSFAGSAQRTTEGVWLSICPTHDKLVVALDFEGVHSIERSLEEDMLLVLFNAALSNLVLYRNNFALGREINHMFRSFQKSSTTTLTPAENPKLFKGPLAVVIKDVSVNDKDGIVKEFQSKFRHIVSKERKHNFITLFHNAHLSIFPWPIIQSREFYTLFSNFKTLLDKQPTNHASAGEFLLTLKTLMAKLKAQDWGAIEQNLIKHRVALLTLTLESALSTGYAAMDPEREELKNLDNQMHIPWEDDTHDVTFCLSGSMVDRFEPLRTLVKRCGQDAVRGGIGKLSLQLDSLVAARISHIQKWFDSNTYRFPAESPDIRVLKALFAEKKELLRASVQLCRIQCSNCHLRCVLPKEHDPASHDCQTSHRCLAECDYSDDHTGNDDLRCRLSAAHEGSHLCKRIPHSCPEECMLAQHRGCQLTCKGERGHPETEGHLCSAKKHLCQMKCSMENVKVTNVYGYEVTHSCSKPCIATYDEDHHDHVCEDRPYCTVTCQLCSRLCVMGDHLHGLLENQIHLCGQEHTCQAKCESPGICEINTEPRSVESTFSGEHGSFQFTKYTQIANRLQCALPIPCRVLAHDGAHTHGDFHFCEARCRNCEYICRLPLNHPQSEHETSHGSMLNTWAIEGSGVTGVRVGERKYAAQEPGTPNICSSVCSLLGRHTHIDYCQSQNGNCQSHDSEHISERMTPNPDRPKDWISHKLFWERTGFKDPYSQDEQAEFSRCDIQCSGDEHKGTATVAAEPSFCTLPIFHPPQYLDWTSNRNGYVSTDGHSFACPNPNTRQSYHIIFALDASFSMNKTDLKPLPSTPASRLIIEHKNNRFGAALSAFYTFCLSRHATRSVQRQDSYSIITFAWNAPVVIKNDSTSTPDQLLKQLVTTGVYGKTQFSTALRSIKKTMETYWDHDRTPVVIFLSDGQDHFKNSAMQDLCDVAATRGKPLSFHAILLGKNKNSTSLEEMVEVADQAARNARRGSRTIPCGYSNAIDTIKLADTFMDLSESMRNPRAALIHA